MAKHKLHDWPVGAFAWEKRWWAEGVVGDPQFRGKWSMRGRVLAANPDGGWLLVGADGTTWGADDEVAFVPQASIIPRFCTGNPGEPFDAPDWPESMGEWWGDPLPGEVWDDEE